MPVKQDGTLHASTLKAHKVPDDERVEAAPGALARFIGAGDLAGYDTRCRILEVVEVATRRPTNDAVDTEVSITIQPQHLTGDGYRDTGGQLRVGRDEGYFTDIVGVVPPGLPTSEHTPGHRGLEHLTQTHHKDIPAAHQPFQPGQPALAAIAGAGQHGDPLPEQEKEQRALEADWQRVYGEELTATPEDPRRAMQAANNAFPEAAVELPPSQPQEPKPAQPEQGDEGDQEPNRQDV